MQATSFDTPRALRTCASVLMIMVFFIAAPAVWVTQVHADQAVDTTALAKGIDKSLRTAENNMFSGKNETADQQLNEVALQIEQLKAADPEHVKLRPLESKFARIRKNLDRKLGASTPKASTAAPGLAPKPAAKSAPTASAAPASDTNALPRAIQSDMSNTAAKLDEAETNWAGDHTGQRTVSGSSDPNVVKLEAVQTPLKSANYYYGNILNKCKSKSSPCDISHPDIAALHKRIEAMEANVAGLNAEIENAANASAVAAEQEAAKAQAAEADCESWNQRMKVYTDGDKALYRCISADADDMPACKGFYEESVALMGELGSTPWAAEPCGALNSTMSELNRYMDNFKSSYDSFAEEQAAARANTGEIVFSKRVIQPGNPSNLTNQFTAGDHIYGLIQTVKPWSEIYDGKSNAEVMVGVKLDGAKIHAQFVKLKSPELMSSRHLVFEVAPNPDAMTAYADPNREYGLSTATMRQGPNELTHHLAQLESGQHTMEFDVTYFGQTWSAGSFTIGGDDFRAYAKMHEEIAAGVAASVTLPAARMTNQSLTDEMQSLLENAGWKSIHRINIVDKDWWLDRVSGGNSAVQSRHIAAAALAEDGDGYYYKNCTFHQDKLLTGGFGDLYISHQGDRVPVSKANIDK